MKILRNKIIYLLGLLSLLALTGCSIAPPQPDLTLNSDILTEQNTRIGIHYVAPEEEATTHIWGANCLLCYGVASALTSDLDSHLKDAITTEELDAIKKLVHSKYVERFPNVKMVELSTPVSELKDFKTDQELGFANKDFRAVKDELDIDVLVIMQVWGHGAYRSFSNYIPNGDPQGYIGGWLYSVDLNTNAYLHYLSIDEKVQPAGNWDQPPRYPSVTTAYYQAVENAKKKIDKSF
ncbi:MAG: hypothetical protein K6L74_02980 [Neptuniibacter sp.]